MDFVSMLVDSSNKQDKKGQTNTSVHLRFTVEPTYMARKSRQY